MKIKATVNSLLPVTKPPKTPLTNTPIPILPTTPRKVKSRPHKPTTTPTPNNSHTLPPNTTIGSILDLNTPIMEVNASNRKLSVKSPVKKTVNTQYINTPNTTSHTPNNNNPYQLPQPYDRTHITGPDQDYTIDRATQILDLLRTTPASVAQAMQSVGLSRRVWWDWLDRYPELDEAYQRAMQTKAKSEVDQIQAEWDELMSQVAKGPVDDATLRQADTVSRLLDRRFRTVQWRAQVHNPALYAPRALLGVQSLDPQSLLAQQYTPPSAQITSYIDSNNIPTADTDSVNNQQVTEEST